MSTHNGDNVTYVNFGSRRRVNTPVETGFIPAMGHSPAAKRLFQSVVSRADASRVQRGREYARQGHVVGLDTRVGAIHGRVAGSQNEPFAVLIQLPYRSNDEVGDIAEILARTPNALSLIKEGKYPENIIDIILGSSSDDIHISCSCPDTEPICAHAVAVVDRLIARMDADPGLVLSFRGLSFAGLEQMMIAKAQGAARDSFVSSTLSVEERNDLFWKGRPLPEVPHPKTAPALQDSNMDLLRKALRSVSHTSIDLLRGVSDIEELYDFLTRQ